MKTEEFPHVPQDLLESLRQVFPDRLPRKNIPYEEFLILQGQQKVVDFLSAKFNEQNEVNDVRL